MSKTVFFRRVTQPFRRRFRPLQIRFGWKLGYQLRRACRADHSMMHQELVDNRPSDLGRDSCAQLCGMVLPGRASSWRPVSAD